uniref:Glycoprotein hormone alpha 2 n=1 Tax=Nannospalax galili TaxID=1026970 RepID=A0A8C6R2R7_NANGA
MPMAPSPALLLCLLVLATTEGHGWETDVLGCHLHHDDCQGTCQGSHVAQACSSAFPSRYSVLVASSYQHSITSVSQCCTISSLKKVMVWLRSVGNRRWGELELFTAAGACQCGMCRLSRY